jgi:heat shock protein HspQ
MTNIFKSKFHEGDTVLHARYKYRGVIVSHDPVCMAPDEWYNANRTQPDRNQPWYQVLVHEGSETYVAEEHLTHDPSGDPVEHPLVNQVFQTFQNGRYHRQSLN